MEVRAPHGQVSPWAGRTRPSAGPGRRKAGRALDLVLIAAAVLAVAGAVLWFAPGAVEGARLEAMAEETSTDAGGRDWGALRAANPACVAWLTVEGTPIDYPVLQATEDDPDYWLSHDFWGGWSRVGSLVVDADTDALAAHTMVYGHHMGPGEAFTPLYRAWDDGVFQGIGTVVLDTPERGTETFRPLFAFRCDKADPEVQRFDFAGGADGSGCDVATLRSWLSSLGTRAEASAEGWQETADGTSRVLTLVTCSSPWAGQRGRTVVVCARV
ncbi:class B sortase [Caniella muris]|uniref:class B sortase n=1 Tax=Caniella muris TaxID=2941502 RepID=UPI0020424965|nr:class B sortase [Caniella muris]